MQLVCDEFGLTEQQLKDDRCKRQYLVNAQKVYFFLARKHLRDGFVRIGRDLNKSHSTVIYAINTLRDLVFVRDPVAKKIERIESKLLNYK